MSLLLSKSIPTKMRPTVIQPRPVGNKTSSLLVFTNTQKEAVTLVPERFFHIAREDSSSDEKISKMYRRFNNVHDRGFCSLASSRFVFRNGQINTQLQSENLFEPSSILFTRNKATSTGSPRQNSTVSDMRNDDEVNNKSTEKDKMQLAARKGSKAMTKG
eukprot:892284_1